MFVHHCTACSRRQLIFPSLVTGVVPSGDGLVLAFTCWCGAEQTTVTDNVFTAPFEPTTVEPSTVLDDATAAA
ncbi:hypothetical protein ABFT23_04655 [Nocardioides sp. C4-1]|uniref:hypothetical protein n=1 Tax=Nocardioides sp. C4-1 TaxID=3151851 RepID=UPI003264401C